MRLPWRRPPSWLLISFDQWRGDWLQQSWLHLPHLRRLVAEGWHAPHCYTASPQCVPARASWLTGLRPRELGVDRNCPFRMPADAPSFVRDLRARGYLTSLVGKTHWTPHERGVDLRENLPLLQALGFDRALEIAGPRALAEVSCAITDDWREAGLLEAYRQDLAARYAEGRVDAVWPSVLPEPLYPDIWLADRARAELAALPETRPWFLWVSFPGPHEPFDVPETRRRPRTPTEIPPPHPRPELAAHLPADTQLARLLRRWPEGFSADSLRCLRQDYADHLELLDALVGGLLTELGRRSDHHRVAVTVISDHGELLGDWGLMLKGCFLEGAVRCLFLHRPPGGRRAWEPATAPGPVGSTEALHTLAAVVAARRRLRPLARMAASTSVVESEFAGETLRVQDGERLLLDASGRPYGRLGAEDALALL